MTTDDLAWVQSRLRNCTNARRQLRICAECLSVAEDTLLERLGYTSLDTFRAAHPQNKQPVCPPVERILFGRGRRALSEQYGLKVWLCHDHHNEPPLGVHFDPAARRVLEQAAQFAFDELHGPGSFAEVFGEEI